MDATRREVLAGLVTGVSPSTVLASSVGGGPSPCTFLGSSRSAVRVLPDLRSAMRRRPA